MPQKEFPWEYQFQKPSDRISNEQIYTLVNAFSNIGVTKIRLTGGEPLLRPDIFEIIQEIKKNEKIEDIALTTNAVYLKEKALQLKEAGLDRITISLDTFDPITASEFNGKNHLEKVFQGIDAAKAAGFENIKINTVVQKGINDKELIKFVQFGADKNCIIRFIELMDVGTLNKWNLEKVITAKEMLNAISCEYSLSPIDPNYTGEVATRYKVVDLDSEIGFITSITQPFCGNCSRARITADGKLYTCLFSSKGFDLRPLLTENLSANDLTNSLLEIWKQRDDRYSELRSSNNQKRKPIEMYQIGG